MKFLLPGLLLGLTLACGGTQQASLNSGAYPDGIFTGTLNSTGNGASAIWGAATTTGELRFASFDDAGVANLANNTGTLYAAQAAGIPLTLSSVTLIQAGSINGSYAFSGDSGTFTLAYNTLYLRPQSMATLAGTYAATAAQTTTGLQESLTLDAAGNVTGTDATGTFSGTLTQLYSNKNLYRVAITYTSGTGAGASYTGLAFWADTASNLTANALYVQMSGTNTTYGLAAILVKTATTQS